MPQRVLLPLLLANVVTRTRRLIQLEQGLVRVAPEIMPGRVVHVVRVVLAIIQQREPLYAVHVRLDLMQLGAEPRHVFNVGKGLIPVRRGLLHALSVQLGLIQIRLEQPPMYAKHVRMRILQMREQVAVFIVGQTPSKMQLDVRLINTPFKYKE